MIARFLVGEDGIMDTIDFWRMGSSASRVQAGLLRLNVQRIFQEKDVREAFVIRKGVLA